MANTLYPKAREKFLNGDLSWRDDTIKAVLVDTALYTYDAAHEFLSDVPVGARVATSPALANKTSTNGVADADDVAFASVTGAQSEALVLIRDTGNAATSDLIAYIDSATGLPVTPNGANINVVWDNGTNRIFKL